MRTTYHVTWQSIRMLLSFVLKITVPTIILLIVPLFVYLKPRLSAQLSALYLLAIIIFGVIGITIIILLVVFLIHKTGTYLQLSSDGLEYHRWPFKMIACHWNEVEKISQGKAMGISFATLYILRDKKGFEMNIGGATFGSVNYKFVPLKDFQGWPDGELKNELSLYAPKLFEKKLSSE